MSPLLLAVLETFLAIAITVLVLLLAYSLSIKFTRSLAQRSTEKQRPFTCGESIPLSKTGLPDSGMYTTVWRLVFRSLYTTLRDKVHTGVLSDWLTCMFVFMVIMVVALMVVFL